MEELWIKFHAKTIRLQKVRSEKPGNKLFVWVLGFEPLSTSSASPATKGDRRRVWVTSNPQQMCYLLLGQRRQTSPLLHPSTCRVTSSPSSVPVCTVTGSLWDVIWHLSLKLSFSAQSLHFRIHIIAKNAVAVLFIGRKCHYFNFIRLVNFYFTTCKIRIATFKDISFQFDCLIQIIYFGWNRLCRSVS